MLLENFSFSEIIECSNFAELLSSIRDHSTTTLVAVNSRLPGLTGSEGIGQVRDLFPHIRLLIMSDESERASILDALSAGAHGYVVTTMSDDEFRAAVQTVLLQNIYVPPLLADRSQESLNAAPREAGELTARQREVLEQMACGKSNKQIANALNIAESTVKVHLNAAFHILCVHNRVSAAIALQKLDAAANSSEPSLPGLLHPKHS